MLITVRSLNLKKARLQTHRHIKATVKFLVSPQFKSSVLWTNSKHMQELVHHRRHGSVRMCVHGYASSAEQQVKHMDQRGKWQHADVHFKRQAWGRRGGVMVECGTTKSSYLYGTHVRDEQGREALQRQAPSENKPFGEKGNWNSVVESWELMFAVLSFSRCGQLEFRSVRKWVVLSWCRKSSKHPPKPSQSNASLLYSPLYVSALCVFQKLQLG